MTCLDTEHTLQDVLAAIRANRAATAAWLASSGRGPVPENVAGHLNGDVSWLLDQVVAQQETATRLRHKLEQAQEAVTAAPTWDAYQAAARAVDKHRDRAAQLAQDLTYLDGLAATFTRTDDPAAVAELLKRIGEYVDAARERDRVAERTPPAKEGS